MSLIPRFFCSSVAALRLVFLWPSLPCVSQIAVAVSRNQTFSLVFFMLGEVLDSLRDSNSDESSLRVLSSLTHGERLTRLENQIEKALRHGDSTSSHPWREA